MVDAGSSIEHLAVSSNDIGDEGSRATRVAAWHLGRLEKIKVKVRYAEIMKYWIYGTKII